MSMASKYSSLSPETLENIIQCPICFNSDVSLHLPSCQHRICQKCIAGIKKRSTGKFICPNCREESSGNFPICRLTEFMRNESLQENKSSPHSGTKPSSCTNCQLCDRDVEADMRCENCKKFICYRCSKSLSCGSEKVKHDCQDVVDLETESMNHLKLWTDQANEQIARQSKSAHRLQGEIDKLNREIQELVKQKAVLQDKKKLVDVEIKEQKSMVEATSGIWESERDPIERIIFVEQLKAQSNVDIPTTVGVISMQPALAFEEAYPSKVYIKSDCIEAINNHIELLQPPEAFITGKPQTDEEDTSDIPTLPGQQSQVEPTANVPACSTSTATATAVDIPWSRGHNVNYGSPEEHAHRNLLRGVQGLLNKITPQNFDVILKKMLQLPVRTERDLTGIVNLVYECAILSTRNVVTYASLTHHIHKVLKVPRNDDPNTTVTFRKLILVRCQKEFERLPDEAAIGLTRAVERMAEPDPVQTNILKARELQRVELQNEPLLCKTRSHERRIGSLRFIGELFNLEILVHKIMHDCMVTLLQCADEESLECLCVLLTTIGKRVDTDRAKPRTDQYFADMRKFVDYSTLFKVSQRTRFKLMDVIDMRRNKWKPRKVVEYPKTLREIRASKQASTSSPSAQRIINIVRQSTRHKHT